MCARACVIVCCKYSIDPEMEVDELLPKDLNISTPKDQLLPGLPVVAGRDIYTIGSKGRGGKSTQTPRVKVSTAEDVAKKGGNVAAPITSPKGKKRKVESHSKTKSMHSREGIEDNPSETQRDTMEVDSPKEDCEPVGMNKSRRSTRTRKVHVSSSSSDSDLSSELSEDEESAALAAKLNRGAKAGAIMNDDVLEDYFSAHSKKTGITTSDHTLAKLSRPKMDQRTVEDALSAAPSRYQHDCQQLYEEYKQLYPYWLFQISNGFNVLLYGVGSKQKLLEDFRKECLSESCHLVVNGFFPGLTIKQVLTKLTSDLFSHSGTFKSPLEQAQFITKELVKSEAEESSKGRAKQLTAIPDEIFLVIHNIDGQMLRGDTAQTALSILAQSPSVHILASVDHINAPLLWDQKKLSRFNWLWHDTTTYEPYRDETSYENSLLVQQSGSLALSSLINVTKSLTPNARGIFELLVKHQLEHKSETEGPYLGMSFHDCYLKCREKFLVNSDVTLRSQLTEFKDHKLVRSHKGHDGVEYLFVPVDSAALTHFLEMEQ